MDIKPKPAWLKRRLPKGAQYENIRALLKKGQLHTVCQEANCPNMWECFSSGTATFLILGSRCTRSCGFCAVAKNPQGPPDPNEPIRVAEATQTLKLDYVVVTSVTRDDLPDGGSAHFAATIHQLRAKVPQAQIEVLIPDFQGSQPALQTVLEAAPDILNHNIETVPRLYPVVRPQADYRQSLTLLTRSARLAPAIPTKSGLMVGLGETQDELYQVFEDLLAADCRLLTLGQYLQPSKKHLPVKEYISPDTFLSYKERAISMGFTDVASAPLVRSSYQAKALFKSTVPDKVAVMTRSSK